MGANVSLPLPSYTRHFFFILPLKVLLDGFLLQEAWSCWLIIFDILSMMALVKPSRSPPIHWIWNSLSRWFSCGCCVLLLLWGWSHLFWTLFLQYTRFSCISAFTTCLIEQTLIRCPCLSGCWDSYFYSENNWFIWNYFPSIPCSC